MTRFPIKTRILILTALFIVATTGFFLLRQRKTVVREPVYSTTMAESKLPLVWVTMCGRQMNCMRGHLSGVNTDVAYDTLTLLPEDRRLTLRVVDSGVYVIGAVYEIRTGNTKELIESTELTDWTNGDDGITLEIPLQNLLLENVEYRLDLTLKTAEKGDVHYYSRIRLSQDMVLAEEMLDLVTEFADRNFNYDEAKENTMYVETDGSADDTQLEYTNLKSTFTNLAFNNLKLNPVGSRDLRLNAYDGNTGEISQDYIVSRVTANGITEYYEVSETYTLRMGSVRLYMLNFSRRIREIFTGQNVGSSKRILLGINDENKLEALSDPGENHTYFVSTRDVWGYNKSANELTCVFSFREDDRFNLRNSYMRHNAHLLRVDENGNLYFVVYGYMNRGEHEGETGIAYLVYDAQSAVVTESFFIPVAMNYEALEKCIQDLSFLGENNMLYLKAGDCFYAIDIMSGSYILLASEMKTGTYAVSKNKERIAWQDTMDVQGSSVIHIMDLNSGQKQELHSDDNTLLQPEGFIGRDLVISIRDLANAWYLHDKLQGLPATTVEIIDDNMVVLKQYKQEGMLLDNITVHDGRVSMRIVRKTADGRLVTDSEDTIVSSIEQPARREKIGSYQTDDKLKVYYVELPDDAGRSLAKVIPVTDLKDNGIAIEGITCGEDNKFSAYADGELVLVSENISDAIQAAYPGMGTVRYHGSIVYSRPGTVTTRVLGDYLERSETLLGQRKAGELLDVSGITLKQLLYFVSAKCAVLAYSDQGVPLMIYAYDRSTISCYNLQTKEREYYGIDEADEMFAAENRDFSCDFTLQ